jgi:hypothetical protein
MRRSPIPAFRSKIDALQPLDQSRLTGTLYGARRKARADASAYGAP